MKSRIEFSIEKYSMLVMKSGKRHMTNLTKVTNQDKIRTLGEKESNKYLVILEGDSIKKWG